MASIDESLDEARIIERALLRIKAIGLAKSVDEVTYRSGPATGYIAAALDFVSLEQRSVGAASGSCGTDSGITPSLER